jgi:hypothetical protein
MARVARELIGSRGLWRLHTSILSSVASVLFSTDGSDTEGWFMNKMISRSNRIKNVLSLQGAERWARADLFFLKDSLQRGMSLVEIAGFLGRAADEVREKAKDLNRGAAHDLFDHGPF